MSAARLGGLVLAAFLGGCGGSTPQPAALDLEVAVPAGWEVYHRSESIVRLRRKSGEADIDISTHSLGPGGEFRDIDALFELRSQPGTQEAGGQEEVTIGGTKARRVVFAGRRVDSGAPVARAVHVFERNAKGYSVVFLAAGEAVAEARAEADAIVAGLRFHR